MTEEIINRSKESQPQYDEKNKAVKINGNKNQYAIYYQLKKDKLEEIKSVFSDYKEKHQIFFDMGSQELITEI